MRRAEQRRRAGFVSRDGAEEPWTTPRRMILLAVLTYSGGPDWTVGFVWGLAYTVILANAVAWVLWLYALRALSAGAAGALAVLAARGLAAGWRQPSPAEQEPAVQPVTD